MPARSIWNGNLHVGRLTLPVKLLAAVEDRTIRFHLLHGKDGQRVKQRLVNAEKGDEVPQDEVRKGYEVEPGTFVMLEENDLAGLDPPASKEIAITRFVPFNPSNFPWYERPYYLAPDGQVARDAFAVIREGMQGKAGIGKVALYGREYLVKVQPREQGLVMYTLRHANEIRSMAAIDELADMPEKVKPEEVKLARQVMGTFEGEVDLQEYQDEYQVGLREIIDAKIEGREVVAPEIEAPPKVVNLMDALRKSLDSISSTKKKSVVAAPPARAEKKRAGARG